MPLRVVFFTGDHEVSLTSKVTYRCLRVSVAAREGSDVTSMHVCRMRSDRTGGKGRHEQSRELAAIR